MQLLKETRGRIRILDSPVTGLVLQVTAGTSQADTGVRKKSNRPFYQPCVGDAVYYVTVYYKTSCIFRDSNNRSVEQVFYSSTSVTSQIKAIGGAACAVGLGGKFLLQIAAHYEKHSLSKPMERYVDGLVGFVFNTLLSISI